MPLWARLHWTGVLDGPCLPSARLGGGLRLVLPSALDAARSLIPRPHPAGILTKPDLVDRGAEDKVVDVVRNFVFHLKKGYMIVKCRGQQDVQSRLSLAEALQKEKAFFEDHPQFRLVSCTPRPGPSKASVPSVRVAGACVGASARQPVRTPP